MSVADNVTRHDFIVNLTFATVHQFSHSIAINFSAPQKLPLKELDASLFLPLYSNSYGSGEISVLLRPSTRVRLDIGNGAIAYFWKNN